MVNDFYTFTDASKNLNIRLYDNEEKINAITSSKSFRGRTILGNGVIAISTTPPRINRLDILIKVQCLHCPKKFKKSFFTNHIFIHDIGRRPLQSGLRFSKFQNYSCTKLGMTKFAKFGRQLVYWQPTQTGNINF